MLEDAEETRFLEGANGQWGYSHREMLSLPYFGLGVGTLGVGGMGLGGLGMGALAQEVNYDRFPTGQVEIRRGEHVHATDGPIGRVQGLVVDPSDHHVTHVLLEEGHLWGRREDRDPDQCGAQRRRRGSAPPQQGRGEGVCTRPSTSSIPG